MKTVCIIVAGGKGLRLGAPIPKQFLPLGDKPLLMHTISNIYSFENNIEMIIVLPATEIGRWKELCREYEFVIPHTVVNGGRERYFSVKNALEITTDNSIVAIHDGVRPFVSKATWERCKLSSLENGTAIPCIRVTSSLRRIEDDRTVSVDRSKYLEVQTPQVFRGDIIKKAYSQDFNPLFTDDASVCEHAGFQTFVTEGNAENIKITTATDMLLAEAILKTQL